VSPSLALPRQRSFSEDNLFSSVAPSDPRGISTFHAPLDTSFHGDLFPHDLAFGDHFTSLKDEHIFRIGYCNVGGFPAMSFPNDKAQELKHFMALYDLDLFGGCEANLNWSKAPDSIRLSEWFRDLPSSRTFSAHNTTESLGLKQFGGTFWISTGLASQYIVGSEKDPLGLGHWVVCSLAGHSQHKIHLVFGYHPCLNSLSHLWSVYAQQARYFASIS